MPVKDEGRPKDEVDRIVLLHEHVARQDRKLNKEKSRLIALEKELAVLREKYDALEKGEGWPADDVLAVVLMQRGEASRRWCGAEEGCEEVEHTFWHVGAVRLHSCNYLAMML